MLFRQQGPPKMVALMSIFLCVIFSICGQGCVCGYSTVAKCNQRTSRLRDAQHQSTHPYMEFSDQWVTPQWHCSSLCTDSGIST